MRLTCFGYSAQTLQIHIIHKTYFLLGGMFYVCVAAGFAILFAGMVIVPSWWKLLWLAAFVALLAAAPTLLARLLDPLNIKRIRAYCLKIGVTDVHVKPFPNHYGVRFTKNQREHYAKCVVARGKITWTGPSPSEVQ